MSAATRERSPLFVYQYRNLDPPASFRWGFMCRRCDASEVGYFAQWRAFRVACEHARTCPALRLARLEAELEKLVTDLRVQAGLFERTGLHGPGDRTLRLHVIPKLTDILARHHRGADA